jgi:hypothetical protein
MDGGDLWRVSPEGQVTKVITGLGEHKPPPSEVSERNYHMSLWTDKEGLVYVAIARERLVLRAPSASRRENEGHRTIGYVLVAFGGDVRPQRQPVAVGV